MPVGNARARAWRFALRLALGLIVVALLSHFSVLWLAKHEMTGVESMVALHSSMLARGDGLYYDLNRYPFTVSAYGPIFYSLSAGLQKLGIAPYQSGRLISFCALLAVLWFSRRILETLLIERTAKLAGLVLIGATSNLLYWCTLGQTDALALCFSLAAFDTYLRWREAENSHGLWITGLFVLCALFAKQTFVAAPCAIGLSLLLEDRRRALAWLGAMAVSGATVALTVNVFFGGSYFANAFLANMNPFSADKLGQQMQYFGLTSCGLILMTACGIPRFHHRMRPVAIYLGFAALVLLGTAPKIGSDLNYQLETTLLLGIASACALEQLNFFPLTFLSSRVWITMLQIPLFFHIVFNLTLTTKTIAERVMLEPERAGATAQLRPYLGAERRRVICTNLDAMVHYRGRIEVEPLIYSILVKAGSTNPEPVRRDIAARRFETIILHEDVTKPPPAVRDAEIGTLPQAQLDEVRKNYRLVLHASSPYGEGDYVYEPRRD